MTFPATLTLAKGKEISLTVSQCVISFGPRTEPEDLQKTQHPVRVDLRVDPLHNIDRELLTNLAETFKLWEDKDKRRLDEIQIDMPDGKGTLFVRLTGFHYDHFGGQIHLVWAEDGLWVPK